MTNFGTLTDALDAWLAQKRQEVAPRTYSDYAEAIQRYVTGTLGARKLDDLHPATLRQFLEQGYWDEIRLLEAPLRLGEGIAAPFVPAGARLRDAFPLGPDRVQIFTRMV